MGPAPVAGTGRRGSNRPSTLASTSHLRWIERSRGNACPRIAACLDRLAAAYPDIAVLITDRLVRREGISPFWRLATLSPVPIEEVRSKTGLATPPESLSIPFYLDRFAPERSRNVDILRESVSRFVPDNLLDDLAEVAFESYRRHHRRVLDVALAIEAVGADTWQRMLEARFAVELPVGAQFEHHLIQDYLSGLHLAARPELWEPLGFDIVTLRAASFDALSLAVSNLGPISNLDDFVLKVYDWNLYGVAYLLQEDRHGDRRIGRAMRVALLASIAEKRLDQVRPTVRRAADALRLQGDGIAQQFLAASTHEAMAAIVAETPTDRTPAWFTEWKSMFTRADGDVANRLDIVRVSDENPILGWGSANALRRLSISPALYLTLTVWSAEFPRAAVRWRCVHALGRCVNREVRDVLVRALSSDDYLWVRYGALRALFEHAYVLSSSDRAEVIDSMVASSNSWTGVDRLREEAARCLDVSPLPDSWHATVEPILQLLWQTSTNEDEATLLVDVAARLRERKAG